MKTSNELSDEGDLVIVAGLDKELVELVSITTGVKCIGVIDSRDIGYTLGIPWLGSDQSWPDLKKIHADLKVVIGVDVSSLRVRLASYYGHESICGVRATDIHISDRTKICETAILQSGVKILADVRVGFCCKINHDVVVHHDCIVGDFCTLAPGSRLLGNVTLEQGVFIGANAVVLPHVSIGRGATVGAGAVVTKDVPPGQVVVGSPAVSIKSRKGTR